jgi:hypothetical protein
MKRLDQPLEIKAVQIHRREECIHYDRCLEEASALLWPSFSCAGCKLYFSRHAGPTRYERAACALGWDL